jgi:hypothetical protein
MLIPSLNNSSIRWLPIICTVAVEDFEKVSTLAPNKVSSIILL